MVNVKWRYKLAFTSAQGTRVKGSRVQEQVSKGQETCLHEQASRGQEACLHEQVLVNKLVRGPVGSMNMVKVELRVRPLRGHHAVIVVI